MFAIMPLKSNERIVYFNGRYVSESEALVPFRDRSFIYGDGAFDMARTFNHRIFWLDEHLSRLYSSLRVLRLDSGLTLQKMKSITEHVLESNKHLLAKNDEYWIGQRVSGGIRKVEGDNWNDYGPTVIVECMPLPFANRAFFYRDGIPVVTPSIRRTPPDSLPPRAKTHNYLNLVLADREVQATNPGSFAILLDVNGNLCEGLGSNIFVVRQGELLSPKSRFTLAGVSRSIVIEIAMKLGIPFKEDDLDLFDAYSADEVFITSTSLCACPVSRINGIEIELYGPITRAIIQAYIELVGCDFVQQYLDRLPESEGGRVSPFSV